MNIQVGELWQYEGNSYPEHKSVGIITEISTKTKYCKVRWNPHGQDDQCWIHITDILKDWRKVS